MEPAYVVYSLNSWENEMKYITIHKPNKKSEITTTILIKRLIALRL